VERGRARSVTLRNVPSFLLARDCEVDVPGLGRIVYDMAYGGNFYALTPAADAGLAVEAARSAELVDAGLRVMAAINASRRPEHPEDGRIGGCHHVVFHEPGADGADARAATAIHPGWLDRSPCGTGTSARMAVLHSRGELPIGADFVNESLLGTRFTGRLVDTTRVGGLPAVVPTVTGRAWITGTSQFHLDPDDPFPAGFLL
jgi:proline racemase